MTNMEDIQEIALKAGEISLKYFNSPVVTEKSVGNLVTNADLEVEKYIRSELKHL